MFTACAFNYNDADNGLSRYANGGWVVAGRAGASGRTHYKNLIAAGGRVAQYVDVPDVGLRLGPWDRLFAPDWTPTLGVSNWPGTRVLNPTEQYIRYCETEALPRLLADPYSTDIFWDVFGERLWSAANAGLPGDWGARMRDLGMRLGAVRDRENPDCWHFFNGTWANGHPAGNPVVEHHPLSELPYWTGYLTPSRWDKPGNPHGLIIAASSGDAARWESIPGANLLAGQASYDVAPAPPVAIAKLPARSGSTPPPEPPPPDPPPPVVEVRPKSFTLTTERAADGGTIVRGRVETDHRDVPLIIARRKYPWGEERCWRYGLEHSLRWGSPPALPSQGVVTFRDHLLPGRQAYYRAFHYPGGMPDCTGSHTSGIECGYLDSTPLKVGG